MCEQLASASAAAVVPSGLRSLQPQGTRRRLKPVPHHSLLLTLYSLQPFNLVSLLSHWPVQEMVLQFNASIFNWKLTLYLLAVFVVDFIKF